MLQLELTGTGQARGLSPNPESGSEKFPNRDTAHPQAARAVA